MENTISGIIVAIVTLSLGWLVGQRLTLTYAIRQKRRELEVSTLTEFYRLYGEFFSIWKQWAYCCHPRNQKMSVPSTAQWTLLEKACNAEGAMEAIFVKLCCEKVISDDVIKILGKFRQAYQCLRESIREGKDIDWWYHDQEEYLSFKRLAYLIACIIVADKSKRGVGDALEKITSNVWENNWILAKYEWSELQKNIAGQDAEL